MKKIIFGVFFLIFASNLVFAYDYTQSCTKTGSCSCISGGWCSQVSQCYGSSTCSFSCPTPKTNSVLTGNNCNSGPSYNCKCEEGPIGRDICNGGTCSCSVSGTCKYTCDDDYIWDGNNCVASTTSTTSTSSTTTTSPTSTTSTSTTIPLFDYDFTPGSESSGLFTIGKPEPILIYVRNRGKIIDNYTISYSKEAQNEQLEDVSHLILVSLESNKISSVISNDVKTTQAIVTIIGPIKDGKITFHITSDATETSKDTSVDLSAGFPMTLSEFNFIGIFIIMISSVLIIFYSLHVNDSFFNCF